MQIKMEKEQEKELLEQLRTQVRLAGIVAIEVMQDKDMVRAIATFYRNLFEALTKEEAFTEAQAMQLLCITKVPGASK